MIFFHGLAIITVFALGWILGIKWKHIGENYETKSKEKKEEGDASR